MNKIRAFFFFVLCLSQALIAKEATPQLSYHLQQGDSYLVNVKQDETVTLTIEKQPFLITTSSEAKWTVQILNVDKKGITTAQVALTDLSFIDESQETDQDFLNQFLDITQKSPLQMTFTAAGEITQISGYEALIKACSVNDDLANSANMIFSQENIQYLFGQFICRYPAKNRTGWSAKLDGFYTENFNYQLASFDASSAHLNFKSNLSSSGSRLDMGSIKMKIKSKGSSEGTHVVDIASGWLLSSTKKGSLSGKATFSTSDDSFSCPINSEFELTIDSKKL